MAPPHGAPGVASVLFLNRADRTANGDACEDARLRRVDCLARRRGRAHRRNRSVVRRTVRTTGPVRSAVSAPREQARHHRRLSLRVQFDLERRRSRSLRLASATAGGGDHLDVECANSFDLGGRHNRLQVGAIRCRLARGVDHRLGRHQTADSAGSGHALGPRRTSSRRPAPLGRDLGAQQGTAPERWALLRKRTLDLPRVGSANAR